MDHFTPPSSITPRRFTPWFRGVLAGLLVLAAAYLNAGRASADNPPPQAIPVQDQMTISIRGEVQQARVVPLTPQFYDQVKQPQFTAARVAATIGLDVPEWLPTESFQKVCHDNNHTVELRWTTHGLARPNADRCWEVSLGGQTANIESIQGRHVRLSILGPSPVGLIRRTVRVELPEGSKDVKLVGAPIRLVYRAAYPFLDGARADVRLKLESQDHLLSCMAKIYANPKFGFWAARMVMTNTGEQRLRKYRVRFQVVGYSSDWSPWQESPVVVPGQTVVDVYYPVLDIDKIARLEEVRDVYLKAEYEYRRTDGQLVQDTKTVQLEILGHNQVESSRKKLTGDIKFQDYHNQTPFILASMTTYQDPVIQQLTGRICHEVGGAGAIYTQADAEKFLEGLYNFMATYISYQSPKAYMTPWGWRQHVMFGRDVLANHAGTCIELSILFASACETVGLDPVLVSIPGHVFPFIRLALPDPKDPKQKIVYLYAIETTHIGKKDFRAHLAEGTQTLKAIQAGKIPAVLTDVKALRTQGVYPLDLPAVQADWLTKVCPPDQARTPRRTTTGRTLAGTWRARYRLGNAYVTQTITLNADGTLTGHFVNQAGKRVDIAGTYRVANGIITTTTNLGTVQGTLEWINDNEFQFTNTQNRFYYHRIA